MIAPRVCRRLTPRRVNPDEVTSTAKSLARIMTRAAPVAPRSVTSRVGTSSARVRLHGGGHGAGGPRRALGRRLRSDAPPSGGRGEPPDASLSDLWLIEHELNHSVAGQRIKFLIKWPLSLALLGYLWGQGDDDFTTASGGAAVGVARSAAPLVPEQGTRAPGTAETFGDADADIVSPQPSDRLPASTLDLDGSGASAAARPPRALPDLPDFFPLRPSATAIVSDALENPAQFAAHNLAWATASTGWVSKWSHIALAALPAALPIACLSFVHALATRRRLVLSHAFELGSGAARRFTTAGTGAMFAFTGVVVWCFDIVCFYFADELHRELVEENPAAVPALLDPQNRRTFTGAALGFVFGGRPARMRWAIPYGIVIGRWVLPDLNELPITRRAMAEVMATSHSATHARAPQPAIGGARGGPAPTTTTASGHGYGDIPFVGHEDDGDSRDLDARDDGGQRKKGW